MTRRTIVTLHLPLDMGAVGRILQVVSAEYPDAVMGENATIIADDDWLTKAQRRSIRDNRERGAGRVVADFESRP